jgi:Fe-S cluster assembly iron-binding protein IscA
MIEVTHAALRALHDLICESEQPEAPRRDLGFRLTPTRGGSLGLGFDAPRPDDHVIEHEGRSVVILDEFTANTYAGCTIDVDRDPRGPSLVVRFTGKRWAPTTARSSPRNCFSRQALGRRPGRPGRRRTARD